MIRGAVIEGEAGDWSSPAGRVGVLRLNIVGDVAAGEEPHADAGAVPDGGINTSRLVVETRAVGALIGHSERATRVVSIESRALGAEDRGDGRDVGPQC